MITGRGRGGKAKDNEWRESTQAKCPKNRFAYIFLKFSIDVFTRWGDQWTLMLKTGKKQSSGDACQGKESIQRDESGDG